MGLAGGQRAARPLLSMLQENQATLHRERGGGRTGNEESGQSRAMLQKTSYLSPSGKTGPLAVENWQEYSWETAQSRIARLNDQEARVCFLFGQNIYQCTSEMSLQLKQLIQRGYRLFSPILRQAHLCKWRTSGHHAGSAGRASSSLSFPAVYCLLNADTTSIQTLPFFKSCEFYWCLNKSTYAVQLQ